jgi:phosphoribosylformylglycinamidine (FGAM) synthase PurS component
MARFSQAFLQGLLRPTYAEGLFEAARGAGMAPGLISIEKKQEEEKQKKAKLLSGMTPYELADFEYKQAADKGDTQAMREAQDRMVDLSTSEISSGASQLESPKALLEAARRIRNTKGVTPAGIERAENLEERAADFAEKQRMLEPVYVSAQRRDAQKELAEAREAFKQRQGLAASVESPELKAEIMKGNPEVIKNVRSELVKKEFKDPETITDYGLMAESTPEDYDAAQLEAINAGEYNVSRQIGEIASNKFKRPSLSDVLDIPKAIDPQWEQHVERRSLAAEINQLRATGGAGSQRLIERVLTSGFPNDLKAVQELESFTSSKSLWRRLTDGVTKIATGQTRDITLDEYEAIAQGLEELSNQRIMNTIDVVYRDGSADEADRLVDVYFPEKEASITSN